MVQTFASLTRLGKPGFDVLYYDVIRGALCHALTVSDLGEAVSLLEGLANGG